MLTKILSPQGNRLTAILYGEVAVILVALAFYLPRGQDWYQFYQPFAAGCQACGFVPYHAWYILAPLGWLTYPFGYPVWIALCLGLFYLALRQTGANHLLFILSFPVMGQFFLGQVDALVCVGLVLLLSKSPAIQSLGAYLCTLKPQLAGLAVLIVLIATPGWRGKLGLISIPALALLASLLQFGWWPPQWLASTADLPLHIWRLSAKLTGYSGLCLLPLLCAGRGTRERVYLAQIITSVSSPYFSCYSYVTFGIFRTSVVGLIASYVWMPWGWSATGIMPLVYLAGWLIFAGRRNILKPT